jgi:hypothetical protein
MKYCKLNSYSTFVKEETVVKEETAKPEFK